MGEKYPGHVLVRLESASLRLAHGFLEGAGLVQFDARVSEQSTLLAKAD